MEVKVEMWAFCEGKKTRIVEVPDDILMPYGFLDRVYHWGQNDFQPKQCPSVSMGDIIQHPDGTRHMVMGCGFLEVPKDWSPKKYQVPHGDHLILPPLYDVHNFEELTEKWEEFHQRIEERKKQALEEWPKKFTISALEAFSYENDDHRKERLGDYPNPTVINDDGEWVDINWIDEFEAESLEDAKKKVQEYETTSFTVRSLDEVILWTEEDFNE